MLDENNDPVKLIQLKASSVKENEKPVRLAGVMHCRNKLCQQIGVFFKRIPNNDDISACLQFLNCKFWCSQAPPNNQRHIDALFHSAHHRIWHSVECA